MVTDCWRAQHTSLPDSPAAAAVRSTAKCLGMLWYTWRDVIGFLYRSINEFYERYRGGNRFCFHQLCCGIISSQVQNPNQTPNILLQLGQWFEVWDQEYVTTQNTFPKLISFPIPHILFNQNSSLCLLDWGITFTPLRETLNSALDYVGNCSFLGCYSIFDTVMSLKWSTKKSLHLHRPFIPTKVVRGLVQPSNVKSALLSITIEWEQVSRQLTKKEV